MMYPIDALYARQSLDKVDSISIENQLEFCKYETRGGDYETYIDKGYSGKNTNRPAFTQMLQDIKAGKIKRVIVYKLDRISRSILDFSNMMETFQEYHVEFVSSTERFDTSTPIGNAMLNISIVFAQLERETIQKRIADAYHTKSQKGYYMGGRVPYGFRLENTMINGMRTSVFVTEPFEMDQIKLIYELYSDPDMTLGAVMRELLNRGYSDKRGAHWCTARLSEIIRNPVYVKADADVYNFFESQGSVLVNPVSDYIGANGIFLYNGQNGDNKKKKQYDLTGRDVVLGLHEGVIDSATWLKCRKKIMSNRQLARTNKGKRSWLTGKVKCKKCGYSYQVTKSKTKAGRYFQCTGARYSIRCKGAGHTIYADVFEDYIFKEIQKELATFQCLSKEPEQITQFNNNQNEIRITEIDQEIESLLAKITDANKTLMMYINRRVEKLDKERKTIEKKMLEKPVCESQIELDKITDHVSKWAELSNEDRQKIVDILIRVIYIDEDTIRIEWNV